MPRREASVRVAALTLVASACVGSVGTVGPPPDAGLDAGTPDAGAADASTPDSGVLDAGVPDAGPIDAGVPDAGPADAGDPCATALLCERFEGYPLGALANNATVGPWHANVTDAHASASIDGTQTTSGSKALKLHIDDGQTSGAQLISTAGPLFATTRTRVYGRFMMFLQAYATSEHWSMFGFSGTVPAGTTTAGANAIYYYSSFDDGSGKNVWGAVYWNDGTQADCNTPSQQLMPVNRWACVSFMFDATAKEYRLWVDNVAVTSLSIDTKGLQCVDHSSNPWWGPDFSSLFIGAYSYHPMTAALDMWVDDFIADVNPVNCP